MPSFMQAPGDFNCVLFSTSDPVEVFNQNSDIKSFPADITSPLFPLYLLSRRPVPVVKPIPAFNQFGVLVKRALKIAERD